MPRLKPLIPNRRKKGIKPVCFEKQRNGVRRNYTNVEKFLYMKCGFTENDLRTLTGNEEFTTLIKKRGKFQKVTLNDFNAICSAMNPKMYAEFFALLLQRKEGFFVQYLLDISTEVKKVDDIVNPIKDNYLHLLLMIVNATTYEKQQVAILEAERIVKGYKFT